MFNRVLARGIFAGALATFLIAAGSLCSQAAVKPGEVITPANATSVKDVVTPGVYYKVNHGMQMKIVPTTRIDWPPPYKDATEKYSAQVRLTSNHRSLIGYVAGQPFPLIDANDPDVATKIMWNNVFRPITDRRLRSALLRLQIPVHPARSRRAHDQRFPGRPLRRLSTGRPHRGRAAADRS